MKRRGQDFADGYERVCFAAMLWGTQDQGRYVLEALMCGAHLQTYSDKDIRRIMYLCPDIAGYPGTKLLSLVWEVRMCEHLQTSTRMQRATHNRLTNVWSKLQLVELLDPEFDLCVVIDTDTMATKCLNDLFFHHAPAAVWRGSRTILQGKRRDARSYGTPPSGGKQVGGINGGLVLMLPNRREFQEMLRHLETYEFTGKGAEQDFLTDFWRDRGGIATLPRKYNCQLHQVALLGPAVPGDSVYWRMVTHHAEDVANWHFSAEPKPVDMVWGSVALPASEASSGSSSSAGPWLQANRAVLEAATTTTPPWRQTAGQAPSFIARGPVREEYAAPWRLEFTVEVLQAEMAKRSSMWRVGDIDEDRREEIKRVMVEATRMWIQSLHDTAWPNIVFMVSEEVRRRSLCGRNQQCLLCHHNNDVAGNNMEHNLFHCPLAFHAAEQIEYAVWKDMVSHPFTLQSGGKRIDQQLCYLGALLQGWEEAAALHVENVKPWTNNELCVAPTKSNWENGLRDKTLQRQYHNQRRHAKRTRFDWWRHNGFEDWLFRDA
jgi:hypothetical protein